MPPKLRTIVTIYTGGGHGRVTYVPQVYWLLRTQAFAQHRPVGVDDRAAGVVAAGLDAQHLAGVRSGQGRTPGRAAAAESMRHSHVAGRPIRPLLSTHGPSSTSAC